ncbi:MAG: hypothetical protein QXI16_06885, partial [Sulfolobaceae archaeon]
MGEDKDIESEYEKIDEKYKKLTFDSYLQTIPIKTNQDAVLQAEKEWFEENVNKARWLEKAKVGLLSK